MNATEGWDKVEVLVHRTDDGRLETDRSTLDRVNSIKSPVHVVAVAGPYRTGKSYLLNSIIKALFGKTNVFPVGNTVQAQTKGITIWCSPHPSVKGHWIIFLDTEGLNDVEQGDRDSDILIFVLTVLLSSTIVYNSCGVIDFRALETIHHVSVLAEKIRMMPDLGEDLDDIGFDLAFPELLWVVRDFQLNLEINGTRITDDEYLQNALSTSNMVLGPKKATVVSVKRCIKEYFVKRKCFLLPNLCQSKTSPVPAGSHQQEPMSDLIDQIAMAECKMHQGSEVTGRVLGKLAEELVEECQRLDSQEPVNVPAIMDRIADKENKTAVAKSLELYRTEMSEKTAEAVDEVTLHQIHIYCSELATTNFMHAAVYPVDSSFIRIMHAIKVEFDKISEVNTTKINELCKKTFHALRKEIIGDNNTKYLCSGGFQKYREDMTKLRMRWEQNPVLQGIAGRSFFSNMMSKLRENEAKLIMDADKSMTELKKQEAVKRQQEERKRLEQLKKQKDETSVNAVERDRSAFEDRVTNQVKSAILRPHEAEISKLNCRIAVLDRELHELRARHAEDEAETCEQRLRTYQRMLSEKQNQPSKWQKVSSSIQSFARGTFDSIRRLFKFSGADAAPQCAATAAESDMSSPSVFSASPVDSRASSCARSSTSPVASTSASPGSSLAPPVSSTAASRGSSLATSVASTAASSGSSSAPPVASTAASSGSSLAPCVGSTVASPGSSSALPVSSTAASSGSSLAPPVSSTAASSGSSSLPSVSSTAASDASASPVSSSVPSRGLSSPAAESMASSAAPENSHSAPTSSALPVVVTSTTSSSVSLSSTASLSASSAAAHASASSAAVAESRN